MRILAFLALGFTCCAAAVVASCATSASREGMLDVTDPANGGDGGATARGFPSDGSSAPCAPCDDFPKEPILYGVVPPNVASLFGPAGSGAPSGGPCLAEPEVGSLFPNNWLRPRFRFKPVDNKQTIFEIRLHADIQRNDLVVYTDKLEWTLPKSIWTAIAKSVVDQPITMTIRGYDPVGNLVSRGTTGPFRIAPVAANGSVVYWTPTGGSLLKGFSVGDESVVDVLKPAQTDSVCIGCHASTPDGRLVAFGETDKPNDGTVTRVDARSADGKATVPDFSPTAVALLTRTAQQSPVFSKGHWSAGDRIAVSMKDMEIIWTDLDATSQAQGVGWGIFARTGDSKRPAMATMSHDGLKIVYASSHDVVDSGGSQHHGDLAIIPYNARQGGVSTTVMGANLPQYNEYYPSFSPDDVLLAYSRVNAGKTSYNNLEAEVFAIPATGGTGTRLAANDPPSCGTKRSPGVTNSWPKWSPEVTTANGTSYYWLIFSSTRGDAGIPQLYVTAITSVGGTLTTYPALYIWNQPPNEGNHTPAWDVFAIPPTTPK